MIDVYDFVRKANQRGHIAYVAGLDIDGAFGEVPHERLMERLSCLNIDPIRPEIH